MFLVALYSGLLVLPSGAAARQGIAHYPTPQVASRIAPVQSTPGLVEYFVASTVTSGVELAWVVISEKDIDGFKIYAWARGGDVYLVNRKGLIPPWLGDYLDGDVLPATTYQYALGVVHKDGSEFVSQPVEVTTSKGSTGAVAMIRPPVTLAARGCAAP